MPRSFGRIDEDEVRQRPIDRRLLWRLLAYLKPYKSQIVIATSLMILAAAGGILGPYLQKVAIDQYIMADTPMENRLRGLTGIALAYLLIELVNWAGTYFRVFLMSWTGQKVVYQIRRELFEHLQTLGFRFYDTRPVGKIMTRVVGDINTLSDLLSSSIVNFINDLFVLVGTMGIMIWMHPRLALYSFLTLPLLIFIATGFRNIILEAHARVRRRMANINANLQESISGVRVTQSFSRENENQERFEELNTKNLEANLQAVSLSALLGPLVELVGVLGMAIVFWVGGRMVLGETLSLGVLVAFSQYLNRFYQPIRDLAQIYAQVQMAMASSERVFEYMDTPGDLITPPDAPDLPPIRGEVVFEDVTFGYDPKEMVLHGISFVVKPGETVALVGPTGAGKSSIINLVSRFYDPDQGRVLIDGQDLTQVRLESLRRQLGIVLQDTFLFSGTVAENIRYGRPEATDDEVWAAAQAVGAADFIASLPQGLETQVQERGGKFSIGQRQLISFARALLADPRILILDEATSSVDAYTENQIQKALGRLLQGRTSFVVAHRLSTIRNADRILVIEDGRIVQSGTHDELIRVQGSYRDLCQVYHKYQEVG